MKNFSLIILVMFLPIPKKSNKCKWFSLIRAFLLTRVYYPYGSISRGKLTSCPYTFLIKIDSFFTLTSTINLILSFDTKNYPSWSWSENTFSSSAI